MVDNNIIIVAGGKEPKAVTVQKESEAELKEIGLLRQVYICYSTLD